MSRPDSNASSPHDSSARLAVITGHGTSNRASAANLSIALARRGKRICLINTGTPFCNTPALASQYSETSLEDLLSGRKVLAETLLDGPMGTKVLPTGERFTNFPHLSEAQQLQLIDLLVQLEATFDYLIVEAPAEADSGLLQLIQAAPLILLTITPEANSLTSAFSLLRAVQQHHVKQPVQVVVDKAATLPKAHDTFKKLRHAASKYLQVELQYIGYFPAQQHWSVSEEQRHAAVDFHSDAPPDHHLETITDRFCAAAETVAPQPYLSGYFRGLNSVPQSTEGRAKGVSPADIETKGTAERSTTGISQISKELHTELSDTAALFDAVHFAGMLAEEEGHQEASF